MIDISKETVISLKEATRLLPRRRNGKKTCLQTMYRWTARRGIRGVVLETIQVGGTKCTSIEALQRFFDRLTQQRSQPHQDGLKTPTQRSRDHARAERYAKEQGF